MQFQLVTIHTVTLDNCIYQPHNVELSSYIMTSHQMTNNWYPWCPISISTIVLWYHAGTAILVMVLLLCIVSRCQTFFLFVIGEEKKRVWWLFHRNPVQQNRQKLSSVNELLTNHKEVFNNLPLMYCRRDLMSRTVNQNKNWHYFLTRTACLLVTSNPNFSSTLVM